MCPLTLAHMTFDLDMNFLVTFLVTGSQTESDT